MRLRVRKRTMVVAGIAVGLILLVYLYCSLSFILCAKVSKRNVIESEEYAMEVYDVQWHRWKDSNDGNWKNGVSLQFSLHNGTDKSIEIPAQLPVKIEYCIWGKWYQDPGGYNLITLPDINVEPNSTYEGARGVSWSERTSSVRRGKYRALWEVKHGVYVAEEFYIR